MSPLVFVLGILQPVSSLRVSFFTFRYSRFIAANIVKRTGRRLPNIKICIRIVIRELVDIYCAPRASYIFLFPRFVSRSACSRSRQPPITFHYRGSTKRLSGKITYDFAYNFILHTVYTTDTVKFQSVSYQRCKYLE